MYGYYYIGNLPVILLFWVPFMASLLWTFGVHFAGQKEDRFVSYLGVSSLCIFTAMLYWGFAAWIITEVMMASDLRDPTALMFVFGFLFFVLQSFLSILFGKLIWKGTWLQSFLTWLFLLVIFFIGNLILCYYTLL